MWSMYSCFSAVGLVSSKRSRQWPPRSLARPKSMNMACRIMSTKAHSRAAAHVVESQQAYSLAQLAMASTPYKEEPTNGTASCASHVGTR